MALGHAWLLLQGPHSGLSAMAIYGNKTLPIGTAASYTSVQYNRTKYFLVMRKKRRKKNHEPFPFLGVEENSVNVIFKPSVSLRGMRPYADDKHCTYLAVRVSVRTLCLPCLQPNKLIYIYSAGSHYISLCNLFKFPNIQ